MSGGQWVLRGSGFSLFFPITTQLFHPPIHPFTLPPLPPSLPGNACGAAVIRAWLRRGLELRGFKAFPK